MQQPLEQYTNEVIHNIEDGVLTFEMMSLSELKQFRIGLSIFMQQSEAFEDQLDKEIERREAALIKGKSTAKDTQSWVKPWGLSIFGCLLNLMREPLKPKIQNNSTHANQDSYKQLPDQQSECLVGMKANQKKKK